MESSPRLHDEMFVMDGVSASELTEEYVHRVLPQAGIDAVQKTVVGSGDNFKTAMSAVGDVQSRIESWENVYQARSVDDIRSDDGIGFVLGFQDTTMMDGDVENVRLFEQLGIRLIQLTYNSRNRSGNGCGERVDGGISNFGLEMIDAIESQDILLDLSHVGPQTAKDALEAATQPTVFSHSNPRAVYDHPRNISDELIKAAVETGGFIGVNAFPDFLGTELTVEKLIEHIEYLDELVGPEYITLGLDLMDNVDQEGEDHLIQDPIYSDPPWQFPEGLESAAGIPNITSALQEHGFSEDEIRGIMGENLLRVYESVW